VEVDAARNVYAAGFTIGSHGDYDGALIKYSAAGAERWVRSYDDSAHGEDSFKAIALSPAGKIGVTGFASPSGSISDPDYLTIQYDSTGVAEWTSLYDGPAHGYDMAASIAYDAAGNVYVTGSSDGGTMATGFDFATLRYDPNGATDWIARWDGGGMPYADNDPARVVAIGPGNSIYVSGWSTGGRAPLVDYVTLRYDQVETDVAVGGGTTGAGGGGDDAGDRTAAPRVVAVGGNPFRDATRLLFSLPAAGHADLALWDTTGRKVRDLAAGSFGAGSHVIPVDGAGLAPGLYFARLRTSGAGAVAKIVRMR